MKEDKWLRFEVSGYKKKTKVYAVISSDIIIFIVIIILFLGFFALRGT